jgi:hypothetical protein
MAMQHSNGYWSPLKAKRDKDGKRWSFSYWVTIPSISSIRAQRLFFWDDKHHESGVVLLVGQATQPYPYIRNLIEKLVSDSVLRDQYRRELRFPLERHYAEFGAFPEEAQELVI